MKQSFIISIVALLACGCTSTQKQQLREQQIIERSKIYYNKGLAYNLQDNDSMAIVYYDSAISLYSKDAGYFTNRGISKASFKEYKEAFEDLKQAIALDSTDNLPWVDMGYIYVEQGDYENALECYKKATSIRVDEFSSCIGGMYYKLGQYREAVDAFNKHLSGKYQSYFTDQILYDLGDSYAHLGQTDSARICWQKSADMGYAAAYAKLDSLKMLGH